MSNDEIYYKIVYLRGDTSKLYVAEMQWFDEWDYKIAFDEKFVSKQDANNKAKELSLKYNLLFGRNDNPEFLA